MRRRHPCWICSDLESRWWRRPASVRNPFSSTRMHTVAILIYVVLLTPFTKSLSSQNEHAHAHFLPAHPRHREFPQLCKNLFRLVYILLLNRHLDGACLLNRRSASREVTRGTPRGSRSAPCSSSRRPRPTRAASRCFITSWRYTKRLTAAAIILLFSLLHYEPVLIAHCMICFS